MALVLYAFLPIIRTRTVILVVITTSRGCDSDGHDDRQLWQVELPLAYRHLGSQVAM